MRAFLIAIFGGLMNWWGIWLIAALDSTMLFFLPLAVDIAVIVLSSRAHESFWIFRARNKEPDRLYFGGDASETAGFCAMRVSWRNCLFFDLRGSRLFPGLASQLGTGFGRPIRTVGNSRCSHFLYPKSNP